MSMEKDLKSMKLLVGNMSQILEKSFAFAEHNIAFRGSNRRSYQDSNSNFLGLVQMLAEFDPVIKEHVDRITNDQIRDHYLGPSI